MAPWRRMLAAGPLGGVRLAMVGSCVGAGLLFAAVTQLAHWPLPELPPRPSWGHGGPSWWAKAITPTLTMFVWAAVQLALDGADRLGVERAHGPGRGAHPPRRTSPCSALASQPAASCSTPLRLAVIGVIDEDPPKAQQMVRQLAGLLRLAVGAGAVDRHRRRDPRGHGYLAIEQVRLRTGCRSRSTLRPEPLRERAVPPVLLQPLVENAVKHGMDAERQVVRLATTTTGRAGGRGEQRGGSATPTPTGLRRAQPCATGWRPVGEDGVALAQDGPRVVARIVLPAAAGDAARAAGRRRAPRPRRPPPPAGRRTPTSRSLPRLAGSVDAAVAALEQFDPDVVFLDVQMPGGEGTTLFDRTEVDAQVVFVTAYDQYAVRAFEVHALDYLLKPVAPERLAEALDRVRARVGAPTVPTEGEDDAPLSLDELVCLPHRGAMRFFRVRDVVHLQAADDYCELHLVDGTALLSNTPLKDWEARLPDVFLRVHRSHVVNVDAVVEVVPDGSAYEVRLRGGAAVPMSRRQAAKLTERLRVR
ncbi:MAG: LytTR family transcriptional regulator DNA-binding domain-containing protein [Myxococcota bacterium]